MSDNREDCEVIAELSARVEELEKQVLIMGERAVVDFDDPQVGACDKLVKDGYKYKDWIKTVGQALVLRHELIETINSHYKAYGYEKQHYLREDLEKFFGCKFEHMDEVKPK